MDFQTRVKNRIQRHRLESQIGALLKVLQSKQADTYSDSTDAIYCLLDALAGELIAKRGEIETVSVESIAPINFFSIGFV